MRDDKDMALWLRQNRVELSVSFGASLFWAVLRDRNTRRVVAGGMGRELLDAVNAAVHDYEKVNKETRA